MKPQPTHTFDPKRVFMSMDSILQSGRLTAAGEVAAMQLSCWRGGP